MSEQVVLQSVQSIDYAAKVLKVNNEEHLMMAQVDVPELFTGADPELLPWATYMLPVGFRENEGDFTPVMEGDWVWVDFPYRTHGRIDTRRPRIKGSMQFAPNEVPLAPHELFDGDAKYEHKRTADEPVPVARPKGEAKVVTMGNVMVEIEREGVYRITNKATGTAFEITEAGETVLHSESKVYQSSKEETHIESGKDLMIKVLAGTATIDADKINLGRESALEPSVLGDQLATWMQEFKIYVENHFHIGDLGVPTLSAIGSYGPCNFSPVLKNGAAYSKVNKNQ